MAIVSKMSALESLMNPSNTKEAGKTGQVMTDLSCLTARYGSDVDLEKTYRAIAQKAYDHFVSLADRAAEIKEAIADIAACDPSECMPGAEHFFGGKNGPQIAKFFQTGGMSILDYARKTGLDTKLSDRKQPTAAFSTKMVESLKKA